MSVQITWWGHATVMMSIAGYRVLTDPLLAGQLAHLRRIGGPGPKPESVRADVVLISHLHADHLHLASLARLDPGYTLIAPKGTAALLHAAGRRLDGRLIEVQADDSLQAGSLTIHAVRAQHGDRRHHRSRFSGAALGYVLANGDDSVWFAGDTGLFEGMSGIGPVDTAIVPVGGWGPTLGPEHLDPVQAAEAVRRVGARDAVPIHYGTFWPVGLRRVHPPTYRRLFVSPGDQFAAALGEACPDATAHVLAAGGHVALGRAR
jgi:L-ascorbate metabolism protein UlaG (beta-lactamase superfamily)